VDGFRLNIKPSAVKELQAIADKATLARLIERIKSFSVQPRPSGSEQLAGRSSLFRIRQGNYRVIFSVDDRFRVVDILKVGHRRDLYR
jgi:mRNA interferase RelE/StbE